MFVRLVLVIIAFQFVFFSTTAQRLEVVTYAQFKAFVEATDYVTDAEKFGWSFVQKNVFDFKAINGANWKRPNGIDSVESDHLPVTQVSYNDALAYCKWSETELPDYQAYWTLIENDQRPIVINNQRPITVVQEVNVLGNVWEITATTQGDSTRLAGGSLYCSRHTCHGTSRKKELYVDKQTGNTHIGFAVIRIDD